MTAAKTLVNLLCIFQVTWSLDNGKMEVRVEEVVLNVRVGEVVLNVRVGEVVFVWVVRVLLGV